MSTKASRLAARKDAMAQRQKEKAAALAAKASLTKEEIDGKILILQKRYNELAEQKPQKKLMKKTVLIREEPITISVMDFTAEDEAKLKDINQEQQRISREISSWRDQLDPRRVAARSRPGVPPPKPAWSSDMWNFV